MNNNRSNTGRFGFSETARLIEEIKQDTPFTLQRKLSEPRYQHPIRSNQSNRSPPVESRGGRSDKLASSSTIKVLRRTESNGEAIKKYIFDKGIGFLQLTRISRLNNKDSDIERIIS